MNLPQRVTICEVGARDGLQNIADFIATEDKVRLLDALSETGLPYIEVSSFVSPRAVPQLADAEEVASRIRRRPGVSYLALVPNARGAQRAIQHHLDGWGVFVSASETHNRRNVNASIAETIQTFAEVVSLARPQGIPVYCAVSMAFGCPYEGDIPPQRVVSIVGQLLDIGIGRIILGDTTGMGHPRLVEDVVGLLFQTYPGLELGLHFHDTRGAGLANVLAGLQAGVTWFDGSVGGLGGCPFAHGATGNNPTEDLVNMLHEMGVQTGVDLDRLLACARLAQELVGRELPGHLLKAGKRSELIKG
jgi:hydroxymethylglutaryl-CoA lyase